MTYILRREGASSLAKKLVLADPHRPGWKAADLEKIERSATSSFVKVFSFEQLDLPEATLVPDLYAANRAQHNLRPRYVYALPASAIVDAVS